MGAGQFLLQTLLLAFQAFYLLFHIHQLRQRHIDGGLVNQGGYGILRNARLVLLHRHLAGISQRGKKQLSVLKYIPDLFFAGNHIDLGLFAGGHIHVGAHVPDGPHRFLDGLHRFLLRGKIPFLPVHRPVRGHNRLLF